MRSHRPMSTATAFVAVALLAAACGSDDERLASGPIGDPSTTSITATAPDAGGGSVAAEVVAPAVVVDDSDVTTDWGVPAVPPVGPTGSLGFDRYVYVRADDGTVIPVVVEGPLRDAVRCQDPASTCSYRDLVELRDSGDPIPDQLAMSRDELEALVSQLDITAATLAEFASADDACQAGYTPVSAQNPNMGIHFVNVGLLSDGFDPAAPEMLLFASADGLGLSRDELGDCGDDGWDGIDGLENVGAAFFIAFSDTHPEGFPGPIDNWHVHYNSCAGGSIDSLGSRALCDRFGGNFFERQDNWMMHTYVAPGHDSQTGVFAMWNDSVWPLGGASTNAPTDPDVESSISQFSFDDIRARVGEEISITNNDPVPHTVTAGSPAEPGTAFDSQPFGTGSAFSLTFDQPGEYSFYCTLHPSMAGTVVVEAG